MKTYRVAWAWTVALLGSVSAVAGGLDIGWAALAGATLTLAFLGVAFGLTWTDPLQHRLRLSLRCAGWFAVAGVLFVGLPSLLGAWALLVLLALLAGAPIAVAPTAGFLRRRRWSAEHLEGMPDRELTRRWRASQEAIRRAGRPSSLTLRLVQERALLLDEMERRDPVGFETWCRRAISREPQERWSR